MNELVTQNKLKRRLPKRGLLLLSLVGGLAVLSAIAYYLFIVVSPLPSDETMIEHFYTHRADFEEVVKRFHGYERIRGKSSSFWYKEGDTPALYERAEIHRIWATAPVWLPDPYSVETANEVERMRKTEALRPAPRQFLGHQYGALVIKPAPKEGYRALNLRYLFIWKDYQFFPEAPRIENGELLLPLNTRGEYSARMRVLPSLNHFPEHWQPFECVYRRIEPRWFLRMCNGH